MRRKKENVEFQKASASLAPPLYYIVLLFLIVASFCALFCAFLRSAKLVENVNLILRKALDEIYKIYMLLHRSDLNISADVRRLLGVFKIRNATKFDFFKFRRDFRWFSRIFLGFSRILSKNAATTQNFSISI